MALVIFLRGHPNHITVTENSKAIGCALQSAGGSNLVEAMTIEKHGGEIGVGDRSASGIRAHLQKTKRKNNAETQSALRDR